MHGSFAKPPKDTSQMSFLYSGELEMSKPFAVSPTFYEFFAGSGMVRAGLGSSWTCTFANDYDDKKAAAYQENWGGGELLVGDVGKVTTHDLPGQANLAWASFPCQVFPLGGMGAEVRSAGVHLGIVAPANDPCSQNEAFGR